MGVPPNMMPGGPGKNGPFPGVNPRIMLGVAVATILGIGALWMLVGTGGDDTGSRQDVLTDEGGGSASPLDDSDTDAPTTTLPPPFGQLGVEPVTGCDYDCFSDASYVLATPEGQRKFPVPAGGDFRVRVTMTNPKAFEAVVSEVTWSQADLFARQPSTPVDGVPVCPAVGDEPLVLAARGDTRCDATFRRTTEYEYDLTGYVELIYLVRDQDGLLQQQENAIRSSSLSSVTVVSPG